MPRKPEPTFGDLFSGAGLFSEGFKQAGFAQRFALELSKDAAASYARNVDKHVLNRSVSDVVNVDPVDVLIAGPPCQGFSTLGRRDPLDVRNDMSLALIPWINQCAPKVVVVENVPPFLRSQQWKLLAQKLTALGYVVETWELDAAHYGAPQLRRRAFTIASRIGTPKLPLRSERLVPAASVFSRTKRDDPMHVWPEPSPLASERMRLVPAGGDKRDILRAAPDLCPPSWRQVGCQATDVWGRIDPQAPANTIRCTFQNPSKGRYLHPENDRVISLREGARLQGVPDSWDLIGRPYPIARQIGNGVPVPLAKAVGDRIQELFN